MNQSHDNPAEMLTREEVLAVLSRVGVRDSRADQILARLEFPVNKNDLYTHMVPYGLHLEALINELGGSP